jgi:hypothetical protein
MHYGDPAGLEEGAMGHRAAQLLAALGLVTMLAGGVSGAYGMWISEETAVELGAANSMIGGSFEDRLERPTVQALLRQSHYAAAGFALIGLGAFLQLAARALRPRA